MFTRHKSIFTLTSDEFWQNIPFCAFLPTELGCHILSFYLFIPLKLEHYLIGLVCEKVDEAVTYAYPGHPPLFQSLMPEQYLDFRTKPDLKCIINIISALMRWRGRSKRNWRHFTDCNFNRKNWNSPRFLNVVFTICKENEFEKSDEYNCGCWHLQIYFNGEFFSEKDYEYHVLSDGSVPGKPMINVCFSACDTSENPRKAFVVPWHQSFVLPDV